MSLYPAKPDLYFFEQYNEMMREWLGSKTQIAPWFLDKPFENLADFAEFVRMLDNSEKSPRNTQNPQERRVRRDTKQALRKDEL